MSLLSVLHLMTVVINMHKPYFIFMTCVKILYCNIVFFCHCFLLVFFLAILGNSIKGQTLLAVKWKETVPSNR